MTMRGVSNGYQSVWPDTCSHGMAWALPCAACGRPYQPPPIIEGDPVALHRIAAALERIAAVLESREPGEEG